MCLFWNIFVKKFMNTFFRVTGFCFLWRVCSYIHITFSRVADNFIFIGNNFINFIAYGWNYIVNNVVCMIVAAICSRFCCISFRICRSVWSYWISWFWIRSYWIYTDEFSWYLEGACFVINYYSCIGSSKIISINIGIFCCWLFNYKVMLPIYYDVFSISLPWNVKFLSTFIPFW